jgi:hypothetical protein
VQLAGDARPLPRALCSSMVSAMACRAARCTNASPRARCATPTQAAAGPIVASSRVRIPVSEPVERAMASTRNGTARPVARSCAPLRPSRYRTISCATSPATVRLRKNARDSTLAAVTAMAAGAGRRKAGGSVLDRASRPSTRAVRAIVSAAASPSNAPATAGTCEAPAIRRPASAHSARQSPTPVTALHAEWTKLRPEGETPMTERESRAQRLVKAATGRPTPTGVGQRRRGDAPTQDTLLHVLNGDRVGIWAPNCAEWTFTQIRLARFACRGALAKSGSS